MCKQGARAFARMLEKNKTVLEEALKEEHEHAAMKVYVTFDTEHGQRRCLNELKVGWIPALMDKVPASWEAKGVAEQYKFRGQHILQVNESAEPSEIMWHNLGTKLQGSVWAKRERILAEQQRALARRAREEARLAAKAKKEAAKKGRA